MKRLGNPRSATLAALLLATSLWLGLAATTRAEAVDTSSHASATTQVWFLQLDAVKGESLDA